MQEDIQQLVARLDAIEVLLLRQLSNEEVASVRAYVERLSPAADTRKHLLRMLGYLEQDAQNFQQNSHSKSQPSSLQKNEEEP